MEELKEILVGMLVLIYGIMFYIMGRTNFIETIIIRKLQDFINDVEEKEAEQEGEK
jgi:hypothetical protein